MYAQVNKKITSKIQQSADVIPTYFRKYLVQLDSFVSIKTCCILFEVCTTKQRIWESWLLTENKSMRYMKLISENYIMKPTVCVYSSRSISSSSTGSLSRSSFSVITSTNSCMRSGNNWTPSMYTPWSHMYTTHTVNISKIQISIHIQTSTPGKEREKYFFRRTISKEADGVEMLFRHIYVSHLDPGHIL